MDPTSTSELAVRIVQEQTDAWNAKDAARFAACYAPDAEVRAVVGDEVSVLCGRDAIRNSYAQRFARDPDLRVVIEHRGVSEGLVTDHEYFPQRGLRATVVFRVKDDLIDRAWIFSPRPLSRDA